MLVSERNMEAEVWMSEVDSMVHGMSRPDMIDVRHAAYRAAAIAIMKNRDVRKMTYDIHREEVDGKARNYRVGERFEAQPLRIPDYALGQHAVTVGMARDTIVAVPRRRKQPNESFVAREEFYIRDFQQYTLGHEPDISVDGWAIPRSDVRLPSAGVAAKDIYCEDIKRFGREIYRLVAAEGVQPPMNIEEMRAASLAEVPRS